MLSLINTKGNFQDMLSFYCIFGIGKLAIYEVSKQDNGNPLSMFKAVSYESLVCMMYETTISS